MMNRDDLLAELELLPVWQLNKPTSFNGVTESVLPSDLDKDRAASAAKEIQQQPLRLILSADKEWLFVLNLTADEEAEQLLRNIFKAIGVTIHQDAVTTENTDLKAYQAKVIVVMGELEAQYLLSNQQPIEALRGRAHLQGETPIVVTYTIKHILENLPDKAKLWEDLCLAKLTIANL